MYTPPLAFLPLLYVVRSAASTYNPVVKEELPSGTYRAKERDNSGKRGASARFMRSLYHSMGKSDVGQFGPAFAFCFLVGSSDILVLIGLETRHTRLTAFDAAILLSGPAERTAHNAAPLPVASSLIDWKGGFELPDTSGFGEPPGSYADMDQAELMDRYSWNFDESEQVVDDRDHLTGGGDGFESRATLPDGDYEAFYETARIGVGIVTSPFTDRPMISLELEQEFQRKADFTGEATTTDDNCMRLALPATDWSLSVHVIRTFLYHNNFLPNKISICYKTDLGWSLEFHEKGTGSPRGGASTGVLKLNKIGYGMERK
ncbi:hypothetical protein FOZ61_004458 [Perkinsus olseni]|uniref:Uncharacterized protein n=1 Tax=Perkinsus olseni TaxID=32597 RepID=A0A7J6M1P4_PEROL|nr:hypothetical protein FOZ61_004458 [Perkinsus olseni]KAF4665493.1 hypothetical protein FOL46_003650 [Perkinsus olseni]